MSEFSDWLRHFRGLHERARRGELNAGEESSYHSARDELARAMLAAQRLSLKPGEKARNQLRVARALQLDIEIEVINYRSMTLDVSVSGFSTVLARAPAVGSTAKVTLRLPATGPLSGMARISDVKPQDGSVRIGASFVELAAADRERLEIFVVDSVLAMLST
jgi:hypothetical protein